MRNHYGYRRQRRRGGRSRINVDRQDLAYIALGIFAFVVAAMLVRLGVINLGVFG